VVFPDTEGAIVWITQSVLGAQSLGVASLTPEVVWNHKIALGCCPRHQRTP